jgi:PAS domain S-box-containing protein
MLDVFGTERMENLDPLRVLVIEDDADTRANLRDILHLDGHRSDFVATAAEALSRRDGPDYSAIILDWTLPDGTAETLLPHLRRACPDAAIVLVTGTVGLRGTILAIRHEVADYIIKPLDSDSLRSALRRIADRRRLTVAKARSEAAFRALVEAAPCAIVIFRPDRTLAYWSPRAVHLIGYTSAEVQGRDYFPLLIRDDALQRQIDAEVHKVLCGGGTGGFESSVWCKNGSRRWFVWNAGRLEDYQGAPAVLAVGQDISARRIADQRLRAEHATARVLAEANDPPDAIPHLLCAIGEGLGWDRGEWWGLDGPSNRLRCRRTWYRPMDGAAEFEAISSPITFAPGMGLPGRVWTTAEPTWLDALGPEELALRARAASEAGFRSAVGFPVLLDGRPLAVLVFFSREPQPSEPELLSCLKSLGRQIGQFIARKQAEERALEVERLSAIGQAMDGLIHEGRNALQRGQACLEMLAIQVGGEPEAVALIDRLQQAQDHLHRLYERVRAFAAPLHLDRQMHNLGQLLAEAGGELTRLPKGRKVRFGQEDGGLDLRALVDGAEIRRVFANILDNALAASGDTAVIDAVWSETLLHGHPALQVAIRDQGPGLSIQARERIFQPFHTTKARGMGLGLATAKRIVEAHEGQIALGNSDRPGAEVVVTLPRGSPKKAAIEPACPRAL